MESSTDTVTSLTLDDLNNEPIWLAWKTELRNNKQGEREPTKVPFAADGSGRGSSTDPKTWGYKREAQLAASQLQDGGVGIVLGSSIGEGVRLGGIDLDTCISGDDIEPWALDILDRLQSYNEVSPSRTGAHILFLYRDADRVKLEELMSGKDGQKFVEKTDTNNHPPSIELYLSGRYFTITEEMFSNTNKLRVVEGEDLLWLLQTAGPSLSGEKVRDLVKKPATTARVTSTVNPLPVPHQQDILTTILYRDDEPAREIISLVDVDLFDHFYRPLVVRALAYREKYRQPMGPHVDTEFADVLHNSDKPPGLTVTTIFELMAIRGENPEFDTRFIRDKYKRFAQLQSGKSDWLKAGTLLAEKDVDGFYQVVGEISAQQELAGSTGLQTVLLSEVQMRPVFWLWHNYIPRRKITIVAGMPKHGKSTIALCFSAIISVCGTWPDGTAMDTPGEVLIFSNEDDIDDTIAPRVAAMGGDPTRIHVVKGVWTAKHGNTTFSISDNLSVLKAYLRKFPNIRLIIIDPVASFLGEKVDGWVESKVRRALSPLRELASEADVSILGIMHFKKAAEDSAMYQIGGSIGFVAQARAIFSAVKEKNTDRFLFMPAGANLSKGSSGFAYRIEEMIIHSETGPITTSRVVWDGEVEGTADDVLQQQREKKGDKAKVWLASRLSDGPVEYETLTAEAKVLSELFSWRSVERAATELVDKRREGFPAKTVWVLKQPD